MTDRAQSTRPGLLDTVQVFSVFASLLMATVVFSLAFTAAPASAEFKLMKCKNKIKGQLLGVQCGVLRVPLDRSGQESGELDLLVQRIRADGKRKGTMVVLAGGPGQAANDVNIFTLGALQGAAPGYDLVTFNQRGTGRYGALRCAALKNLFEASDYSPERLLQRTKVLAGRCAAELGSRRYSYTTLDSVEDIEALRSALGTPQLALAGVSYGTYVAEYYAQRYPERVDRLVLDSVVPLRRSDAFSTNSYRALRRAIKELCDGGACGGVTKRPVGDFKRLVGRLKSGPLRGYVVDKKGRRKPARLGGPTQPAILSDLVQAGRLQPRPPPRASRCCALGGGR